MPAAKSMNSKTTPFWLSKLSLTSRQTLLRLLVLMAVTLVQASAWAQSNVQNTCPYDTSRPPCTTNAGSVTGCPIPNYQFQWQQDCCGAIRLCKDTNTVYNQNGASAVPGRISTAICGEGCRPEEINNTNTCMSSSENQTTWYVFEVRPLKDGGQRPGDFAGYLRMKIIPCDVPPNPDGCTTTCDCDRVTATTPAIFNDNGANSIGTTDYDWILYEVTAFPRNLDLTRACPLIRNAVEITGNRVNNRPWVRRCNYTGTRGPTGLYDPGTFPGQGDSTRGAGGNRFLDPMPVYVGQRFVLAVDNFSTNPQGYKIDFTGRGNRFTFPPQFNLPDPFPTATVVPPSGRIFLDTAVEASSCADNLIRVRFNRPIPYDSIVPQRFKIENPNVPPITILDIKPVPSDTVLGYARSYVFTVSNLFSGSNYKLIQLLGIDDPCGNQDFLDTATFDIRPFTYFDTVATACQNPDVPARFGNSIRSVTVRSKINRRVSFNEADYRYRWKLFQEVLPNGDSLFVPIGNGVVSDSISTLPPLLTGDPITRRGPAILYTPRGLGSFYKLRMRLVAFIATGQCVDSTRLDIPALPTPYYPRPTVNVCFGNTISLSVPASDTAGRRFQWISRVRQNWQRFGTSLNYVADSIAYDSLQLAITDRKANCTFYTQPFAVQAAQRYFPDFQVDTVGFVGAVFPMQVRLLNRTRRLAPSGRLIPIEYRGLHFAWDMGNGDVIISRNADTARYTYRSPNASNPQIAYAVSMKVVDSLASLVNPPCQVASAINNPLVINNPIVPNILSASGDGTNDNFVIIGISPETSLKVMNRYGVEVFNAETYNNNFNGSGLPAGSYFYLAKDRLTGRSYTGWLEVVR